MLEQSPTGTPRMSPRRVPLYLALAVAAAATFTAAGQLLPQQYELARVICTVLGVGIGAGLGVASPGLRRSAGPLVLALAVGLSLTGCATSFRHPLAQPGTTAFTFTLSPEQCAQLSKERRTYHATQETASYVGGAGAVLTTIFLALVEEKAAPAASAGASLAASGVSIFAGSQVAGLEEELQAGGCR